MVFLEVDEKKQGAADEVGGIYKVKLPHLADVAYVGFSLGVSVFFWL